MKIDLGGKVILVTGASSGIGKAAAKYLAKCKATIAIHYNKGSKSAERLAKEIGNNSKPFHADLLDPRNGVNLFKEVVTTYQRVDVLVNNAGLYKPSPIGKPVGEWLKDWQETLDVNLTSAAVLCREAIKHFKKNKGGRIINIASRAAFRGDTEDYFAYAAAKGGMVSLSRTIARAYGKFNIVSFVIAPGYVRTRMTEKYFAEHGEDDVLTEMALNKITEPEDIAPTIAFFASGLMDHATGTSIDINAGSYVR